MLSVMVCGFRESLVDSGQDLSGYERFAFKSFKLERIFSVPLPTTYTPNNLNSITYNENSF